MKNRMIFTVTIEYANGTSEEHYRTFRQQEALYIQESLQRDCEKAFVRLSRTMGK